MKPPTAFIATCRCGKIIGAMDYERTDMKDAGAVLGKWLHHGCTITPKFESSFSVKVESCECK